MNAFEYRLLHMLDPIAWVIEHPEEFKAMVEDVSGAYKEMVGGINPAYPRPGEDAALDWMRSQGLPDPGTPEVEEWVADNIIGGGEYPELAWAGEEHVRSCCCYDFDAYGCWRTRYGLGPDADVVEDGGPCMCSCHDDVWGDDDY